MLAVSQKNCSDLVVLEECNGMVDYTYDEQGCPVSAECNNCYEEFDSAREKYDLVLFVVSSIFGLVAIMFGLFYKNKKNAKFWDLTTAGFLIGGLISLFIGTGFYYEHMGRFLRPIVILVELVIVLVVTYKVIKKK